MAEETEDEAQIDWRWISHWVGMKRYFQADAPVGYQRCKSDFESFSELSLVVFLNTVK